MNFHKISSYTQKNWCYELSYRMRGDRFWFLTAEPLSHNTSYFIVVSSFHVLFHTLSGLSLTSDLRSKQSPPHKWRHARSFMIGELFSLWPGIALSWGPSTTSGSSPGGPSFYRKCPLLFLKTAEANLPNEQDIPQSKSSKFLSHLQQPTLVVMKAL